MYYQNEPRFSGVYSRDNSSNKIKDGAYIINLDEYSDLGTHRVVLYVNDKTAIYLNSFGDIIAYVFRIQAHNSIMCGYFRIVFIDFMSNDNSLTDFTNPFSPNDFKKR